MNSKQYDVVIIGAGLSGLVCAYTLASYGVKCCLVEKSEIPGGGNLSFKNELGDIFDSGYHALDYMRSKITSDLFKKVVNEDYYKYDLNRGLVMEGCLFPYNQSVNKWPKKLTSLPSVPSVDTITGEVTKEKLSKMYGKDFIDYCFDEILASYPSEIRAIKEGRPVSSSLGMIYPWFFPCVEKKTDTDASEWSSYHSSMRDKKQAIIYPKKNGFYGFIDGLINAIDKNYCDIFLGCKDIKVNIDEDKQCKSIHALNMDIRGRDYFWCAPFFGLAGMLGLTMPKGVGQTLVLGSFRFSGELSNEYHEILVGDKNYKINRISFPGLIREGVNNLVQVEYLYPTDELDMTEDQWLEHWVMCLS